MPTARRQSGEDPDMAVEGAVGKVEGATSERIFRQVAREVLLALQLDL